MTVDLTVSWQKIIETDGDPFRSEYGNLFGYCDDPRLGHRIVVVKNFTPWAGSDLPDHGSCVFRAVPNLESPDPRLAGQVLSINGTELGTLIPSNQNPFRPWELVPPDDNGNIPTVDLMFAGRDWVDTVGDALGVPRRGEEWRRKRRPMSERIQTTRPCRSRSTPFSRPGSIAIRVFPRERQ